jgi:bifunctional DNase/RNase
MFRYIDSDGKILTDEIQDFWRLPSADEYARLFMRESENAEGYFDYGSGKADFRVTPDKEAPLWAPEEMVIYYWTSDSVTDRKAYDITYSGEVGKISKLTKQDYRGWRAIRTGRLEGEPVRMAVESIAIDRNSGSPVVLLKQVEGDIYLPIWIGEPEAYSIALELTETKYPRPLTHDLVVAMLGSLSAEISSVEINGVLYGVFLAAINLKLPDGSVIFIDSRPSDAIALALRVDCDILASSAVLEVYGISFDSTEDRSQQFEKLQV